MSRRNFLSANFQAYYNFCIPPKNYYKRGLIRRKLVYIYVTIDYSQQPPPAPTLLQNRNFNLPWSCKNFRSVEVCISYFFSRRCTKPKHKDSFSRADFAEFFPPNAQLTNLDLPNKSRILQLMHTVFILNLSVFASQRKVIKMHAHLMWLETFDKTAIKLHLLKKQLFLVAIIDDSWS